jgi:inorganic triphosphatase YgiF
VQSNPDPPLEEEVTLVICSPGPRAVLRDLAAMESIAQLQLVPGESLTIRDLYFDTSQRILQTSGWALRVRTIGPRRLLALKGAEQLSEWGAVTRIEIEADWSQEILARVHQKLRENNVPLLAGSGPFDPSSPVNTMHGLGLETLQDRRMFRHIRRVYSGSGQEEPPDVELTLDTVLFNLEDRDVEHYEVEIEIRTEKGREAAKRMVKALKRLFPSALKIWPHNKLATGLALEKLARRGDLDSHLGGQSIPPRTYEAIDKILA